MTYDPSPVAAARISPRPSLPGAWFDADAAETAVNFFPWFCRFTAGSGRRDGKVVNVAGRPFHLGPWQDWITRQAFGWKREDGTRLYRRVIIWVPRKNGKTEWAAGIAHLALARFGMLGGEVYSIAATTDQAAIVFNAALAMVAQSEALSRIYEPLKRSLYCPALHTVFRPLSGKAHGKHGLKCMALIGDEAHEWRDSELYMFVRQSMGLWAEPLEWIISTGGKPAGFGHELWDESEKIAEGSLDDPETLVVMYGADPKTDDIWSEATWRKANPNFGVSIDAEWFRNEARKARQIPSRLATFKRYHLNIWAEEATTRLPPEHWAACTEYPSDPLAWQKLADKWRGRPCFGGLDLASTRDTNALLWLFPPAGPETRWGLLPRIFWPRDTAEEQVAAARIPVARWESEGAIHLTDGNVADHKAIAAQVIDDCARFQVQQLGVDPFNAHQILVDLNEAGVPLIVVKQRMAELTMPTKMLERLVLSHGFEHGGQPVLKWMAANVAFREDDQGNIMPTKRRSTGRIDGIAATVTALAVAQPGGMPAPQSYLASDGLMIL